MSDPELTRKRIRELELEEVEYVPDSEILARVLRIISSPFPFLGALVAEAIPNQRLDRFIKYAKLVSGHIGELEEEFIKSQFMLPGALDIWSEGARQAAEAYTEEKISHIAAFVSKAVTTTEIDILKVMSVAKLLEKVNHVEIIILRAYSFDRRKPREQKEFKEKYPDVFDWRPERYIGHETPEGDLERWGFLESCHLNLDSLGLLYMPRRYETRSEIQLTINGAELLRRLNYDAKAYYSHRELREKEENDLRFEAARAAGY